MICRRSGYCCDFTFITPFRYRHTNQVTIICYPIVKPTASWGTCTTFDYQGGWACGGHCIPLTSQCNSNCGNYKKCNRHCCPPDYQGCNGDFSDKSSSDKIFIFAAASFWNWSSWSLCYTGTQSRSRSHKIGGCPESTG